MAKKNTLSFDEILLAVQGLSLSEMRKLNTVYCKNKDKNMDERIQSLIMTDLQNRVIEMGINKCCPKCGSKQIIKFGTRNHVQRLKCKDCNHRFTYFTGTILEKTKFHWDFWISMIHMMLNNASLEFIKANLEEKYLCPGIHIETLFHWRHKIFEAAKHIEKPQLRHTVQIDETYVMEAQKHKKTLINPLDTNTEREARVRKTTNSFGVMGPEFANILCAVDQIGHVIAKHVGVGACKEVVFEEEFHPYLKEMTWLCTDANRMYQKYANKYSLNHYIRPSNYVDNLNTGKRNGKTEEFLYNNQMLDYLNLNGIYYPTFKEFKKLKKENDLNLSRVNQFHSHLKQKIEKENHGVSLQHLDGYVAWECLLRNYAVDHGHTPSTEEDAKNILTMLLKSRSNITTKEIESRKPDFSNVNKHYLKTLMQVSENVRKKPGRESYYLSAEDVGPNFNKREFIDSLPLYLLKFLCNYCEIPGRSKIKKDSTYRFRRALEKHEKIDEAILEMRAIYGTKQPETENNE